MGLIIKKIKKVKFKDILRKIGVIGEEEMIIMKEREKNMVVRNGGKVDRKRGFVMN